MELLVISPVNWHGDLLEGVHVEVGVGTSPPVRIDGFHVSLPDSPRPLELVLRIADDAGKLFPVELRAAYQGQGALTVGGPPGSFAPPRAAVIDGRAAISLIVYLSRIRDATVDVLAVLNGPRNANRMGFTVQRPFDRITVPPVKDYLANFLNSDGPVRSLKLSFQRRNPDPKADHVVFELKVPTAPKLLSVAWPDSVARVAGARPDILVYFHPDAGQNYNAGYYHGSYPFSFDYCYFGICTFQWYDADPLLRNPFNKGLPFQLAAAGVNVVTVLPVNGVGPEVGILRSAESMNEVLHEIVGCMMRRRGVFHHPSLGRLGLASFSAGNRHVTTFLQANRDHSLCATTLKEVYAFEVPGDAVDPWLTQASGWITSGDASDKRARIYTLGPHDRYAQFLGRPVTEQSPHFATSADGRRTASVTPIAAWAAARGDRVTGWQDCHQLVSALCLTHAAHVSGFKGV